MTLSEFFSALIGVVVVGVAASPHTKHGCFGGRPGSLTVGTNLKRHTEYKKVRAHTRECHLSKTNFFVTRST